MAVEEIKCAVCGFTAEHVSFGGRGKMEIDAVSFLQTCHLAKQESPFNMDCKHLNEALTRPRRA